VLATSGFWRRITLWHPAPGLIAPVPWSRRKREPPAPLVRLNPDATIRGETKMKGIFAWLIGIPIPIIIVLYLLDVF
jgi:hypothetical protein